MSSATDTLHVTFDDRDSVIAFAPSVDVDDAGWRTACVSGSLVPSIGAGKSQSECSGSSVLETVARGAEASFSFFGRAVTLYGEARTSQYSVEVDGQPVDFERDGAAGMVARVAGLQAKDHTLRLVVSEPQPKFTFDRADIDTAIPGRRENTTFHSIDPRWTYSPANSGWFRGDNVWPGQTASNQTVRVTFNAGDTATLKFHGQAVYLFGVRAADHAAYDIFLDGVRHGPLDGQSKLLSVPRAMLFFAAGLNPSSEHTLALTNGVAKALDFEFALVLSSDQVPVLDAPSVPGGSTTTLPGGSSTATHAAAATTTNHNTMGGSQSSNTPVIIGCVIGAAALSLTIGLLVFMLMRRRRGNRRDRRHTFDGAPAVAQVPASHLYLPEDTSTAFAPSLAPSSGLSAPPPPSRMFAAEAQPPLPSRVVAAEALPPYTGSRTAPPPKRPF